MRAAVARGELRRGLTLAASGELGAIRAYLGHRRSLPQGADRDLLVRILKDEIRHRRLVIDMLGGLGGQLDPRAERKLTLVGDAIAAFCRVGGWFVPMVGAARLECDNIVEYEILARLAWWGGEHALIEPLLHLAEVEWDHEVWLRERAMMHPLWRCVPRWPRPRPRAALRADFEAFLRRPTTVRRRFSLLVR